MKIYIDISDMLMANFISGIQRVVREVITGMWNRNTYDMVFLVYERKDGLFREVNKKRLFEQIKGKQINRKTCIGKKKIRAEEIERGSVLLEIDGVWHSTKNRAFLYPVLSEQGVKIINWIYDVIPITDPVYSHESTVMNYLVYFGAVLKYSSLIIANAQATVEHIKRIAGELQLAVPESTVIPLGADFGGAKKKENTDAVNIQAETKKAIGAGRYILMVGTIEPRKNHAYLLDALDAGLAVNVVFAGRQGWNVEKLVDRMKSHPKKEKQFFWINNASDADIDELYRNAYYVVFPTKNEGYGLPVVEAIQRGVPVIGSDIPVVREVGKEYISYVDNTRPEELVDLIKNAMDNEEKYAEAREKLKDYVAYRWDDCVNALCEKLEAVC